MSQSLSNVLLHIVFSTKNRQQWIDTKLEQELFPYIAKICNELDCPIHKVGGTDDHIHIACSLARTVEISKLLATIKANSSRWIKSKGSHVENFSWQNGYGVFSVGQSQLDSLKKYIAGQREHHRRETFQDEFRKLLFKYQVDYDERYVWD
ncbi:MAG: IS200/IS605 family transposase [Planctomycetes bacterium]|nr:IS200/IS605 family transposase [Planctomycetota bacterium]